MFTVIFADKKTLNLFEETKMFFGPLYDKNEVAFCEWDEDGETFDEMVPGLYDLIEYQKEWRALILYNGNIETQNPFDYTMYVEPFDSEAKRDWEFYHKRRSERMHSFRTAVSNPLVKLTTALCGMPNFKTVITDGEEYQRILSGEMQVFEFMMKAQMDAIDCGEMAAQIEKYHRNDLKRFVDESNMDTLIDALRNEDVSGIIQIVPDTEIQEFIKFIGQDPSFYDPEYTECILENTEKMHLLEEVSKNFSMIDKLPTEILCLSPRTFDFENLEQDIKWRKLDENRYSRFQEFNLYNDKLKFILFDILPKENKQYKFEQIKFMCLLLVFANNALPQGIVNAKHVYRANIDFDIDIIKRICEKYISKLKATEISIKETEIQFEREYVPEIDNRTAQRLFETNVTIPVKIDVEHKKTDLYAKYKKIGLSTDCPTNEKVYWSTQYRAINKHFIRYLREPRRAVKFAITDGLRNNNCNEDERSAILTENQREDVLFHLYEEEQHMVESVTTHLFDTAKYTKQIQEADENIVRGINQRMSKKKTIVIGIIAIVAYLIGFLPMIFQNTNDAKSLVFSLGMAGIAIGVFALCGFLYLFVLRKRLINRFKHFNYVMSGICGEIMSSLSKFSVYISNACNVMRDFSVLKEKDSSLVRMKKVFRYHQMRIEDQVQAVYDVFSKYVDFKNISIKSEDPYEYDYTITRDYEYDMPDIYSMKRIEYLQEGNEITIPVDYVEKVTLTREELYD